MTTTELVLNMLPKTGRLTCQLLAHEAEDILLITDDGTIICVPVGSISTLGSNTQGVCMMRVAEESKVVGVAKAKAEEEEAEAEESRDDRDGKEMPSENDDEI